MNELFGYTLQNPDVHTQLFDKSTPPECDERDIELEEQIVFNIHFEIAVECLTMSE